MTKKRTKDVAKTRAATGSPVYLRPPVLLAVLSVCVIVCFFPVTKYFFAQDDFVLLHKAAYDGSSSFTRFFDQSSGQFRPLSKALYFWVTYRLFGFNPFPYHVVSLLLHVLNIILVYRLLTRLKIAPQPSLATAALFGLSVTVLNVVGWISCIQQLLGQCFMLLFLLFGINALHSRGVRDTILSIVAYVLAVMSMEQTLAAPLVLWLAAAVFFGGEGPASVRLRDAAKRTSPQLVVFGLFFLFLVVWKGIPSDGSYAFSLGTNVAANLSTYLDWMYSFSVTFPFTMNEPTTSFTAAHLFLVALIVYNVARGRGREVIFAAAYFGAAILPALFLTSHTFLLHLYIPSLGALYLMAMAFTDFFAVLSSWNRKAGEYAALGVFVLMAFLSSTNVRANEKDFIRADFELPKNFVFRRAIVAKNVFEDVRNKTSWRPDGGFLYMVSLSDVDGWYSGNVIAALGKGDAFRLYYDDPKLDVVFMNRGETIPNFDPRNSLILLYDDRGRIYTTDEAEKVTGQPAVQQVDPE